MMNITWSTKRQEIINFLKNKDKNICICSKNNELILIEKRKYKNNYELIYFSTSTNNKIKQINFGCIIDKKTTQMFQISQQFNTLLYDCTEGYVIYNNEIQQLIEKFSNDIDKVLLNFNMQKNTK